MSFLRKRRVQLPNGKTVEVEPHRRPPSLQCDQCGETFHCLIPFRVDGAGCIRCDNGRVHPTEHLEDLLRLEAKHGIDCLEVYLRGLGT